MYNKEGKEKKMMWVLWKRQVSFANPPTSDLITSEVNKARKQTEVIPKGDPVVWESIQGSFPVSSTPETSSPPLPALCKATVPSLPFWEVCDYLLSLKSPAVFYKYFGSISSL